ncbi:MAG: putative toxin-antitoxin system toxin component, PIN family [Caldilineales bacterium]|nr:putative toxin-antitoxin system toxin component, PIN family [Caldilineales bacterium]
MSALLSQRGAAYRLLMLVDQGQFEINLSVPLVAEYEAVAKRSLAQTALSEQDLDDILDYICSVANLRKVFFLWRPLLRDASDDMVLELAVASESKIIVTFNEKDFAGCEQFGIEAINPRSFLQRIGVLP